jgi:hypothetical protein
MENDGHQIEEEHCFSSIDQRRDRGGKHKSGSFGSRLMQQASQVMG